MQHLDRFEAERATVVAYGISYTFNWCVPGVKRIFTIKNGHAAQPSGKQGLAGYHIRNNWLLSD